MERNSCKNSSEATSPSPPYVYVDKIAKDSLMMVTDSACEKHCGGRRVQDSMTNMQMFKTG